MGDSSQAPRVGSQPYNEGDHATQLLADIAALRSYRTSVTQKSKTKNLPWTAINGVFESIEGYIKKSRDQPSLKELQTDFHASEKANGILRRDVILIKNTLDSLAGGLAMTASNSHSPAMRTRVQNAKLPTQQLAQAMNKSREITVKINDSDQNSQVRRATRVQIMEQVNGTISRSKHQDLQHSRIQVIAIKRHPSGDLTLYTDCKEHTDLLIKHRTIWENSVGPKAKVVVPTYGILVHGISTELNAADTIDIENRIKKDNPSHRDAQITYTGWLKKDITGKRASTMVIEFDSPNHADAAILKGLVSGAQMFTCEYYDRSCKLKQCFRCQQYGHIGTHCKAVETCSYCAGHHDSRNCEEKGRTPKPDPKCANCGGKHPAWSPHCSKRKAAYLQLEEARNRRPHTHQESMALQATWVATQTSETATCTQLINSSLTSKSNSSPSSSYNSDVSSETTMTDADPFPALPPSQAQLVRVTRMRNQHKPVGNRPAGTTRIASSQRETRGGKTTQPAAKGSLGARPATGNKRQAYEIELSKDTTESEEEQL